MGNIPVFWDKLGTRMDYPLSWNSGNFEDFALWKDQALAKYRESLLYDPPEVPFEAQVIDEEDRGGYVARKVVFNLTADSRVLTYMLVPKGEGPFPAVLLLHDHGARFDIGKEKMIRPFNDSPERLASAEEWVVKNYSGRYVGDELAKKGYVCFATDALNWGDRAGAGYDGQQALASTLMFLGSSLAGVMAHEDCRAASFLAAHPAVDPARVAAMGHSMGGYRTWQVAALSVDIRAGAAICWMATVKSMAVPGSNLCRGNSGYNFLHPGIHKYMDFPDMASLACPKPMLFYNGELDHLSPLEGVKYAYDGMRSVWDSQDAGGVLVTRLWNYPHIFNEEMQKEAFVWLDGLMK